MTLITKVIFLFLKMMPRENITNMFVSYILVRKMLSSILISIQVYLNMYFIWTLTLNHFRKYKLSDDCSNTII